MEYVIPYTSEELSRASGGCVYNVNFQKEEDALKDILTEAGYKVVDIKGPLEPLEPIVEAIKDAPFHWP